MPEENNNKVSKREQAAQTANDILEVGAKGAATYFGGPAGGQVADAALQTGPVKKSLSKVSGALAKNPITRGVLNKATPAVSAAKPLANAALGGLSGKPGMAAPNAALGGLPNKSNMISTNAATNSPAGGLPEKHNSNLGAKNISGSGSKDTGAPGGQQNNSNPLKSKGGLEENKPSDESGGDQDGQDENEKQIQKQKAKIKLKAELKKKIIRKLLPIIIANLPVILVVFMLLMIVLALSGVGSDASDEEYAEMKESMSSEELDQYENMGCTSNTCLSFMFVYGNILEGSNAEEYKQKLVNYINSVDEKIANKVSSGIVINRQALLSTLFFDRPPENVVDDQGNDVDTLIGYMINDDNNGIDMEKYWQSLIDNPYFDNKKNYGERFANIEVNDIEARKKIRTHMVEDIQYIQQSVNGKNFNSYTTCGPTSDFDAIKVNVTDDSGNTMETLTFYEYVKGVLNGEEGNRFANSVYDGNKEGLKAFAIAAGSYALHSANYKSGMTEITIESSNRKQVYCSLSKGCHQEKHSDYNAYLEGAGSDGNYWKAPTTDATMLSRFDEIVNSIKGQFVVEDGGAIAATQYRANSGSKSENKMNVEAAMASSKSGSDYKTILANAYSYRLSTVGELSVSGSCSATGSGYPLDNLEKLPWRNAFMVSQEFSGPNDHGGIDINGLKTGKHAGEAFRTYKNENVNIYAVAGGIVTEASFHSSWGNHVKIAHDINGDGNADFYTLYAHMKSLPVVSVNSQIAAGGLLGYIGTTGTSTGEHLHFEVYVGGSSISNRVNPTTYLNNLDSGKGFFGY